MKKVVLIIFAFIAICIAAKYIPAHPFHKMVKEHVIVYADSFSFDSFRFSNTGPFGCYKKIIRQYNYEYHDSTLAGTIDIDRYRYKDIYLNEYKDTICIAFNDYRLMWFEMDCMRGVYDK